MDCSDVSMFDQSLIDVEDFSFYYLRERNPSCNISHLKISKGEFVVLCGPSGGGKSTFLKLLNGLIPDYEEGRLIGKFRSHGVQLGEKSAEEWSHFVTSVLQDPSSQFFYQKVQHELVFPCENQGIDPIRIRKRLDDVSQVFQLNTVLESDIEDLSGGQQERVALATARMQDTDVIVFDEPTANLDEEGIARLVDELKTLHSLGKTIIVADHRLDYLEELAETYLYFYQGELLHQFTRERFLNLSMEDRRSLSLRSNVPDSFRRRPMLRCDNNGLEIRSLSVKRGKRELAWIQNLSVSRGSITGITGKNGSGKTSLAYYMSGLLEDKQATFSLEGCMLTSKERMKRTAFVMQNVRKQLCFDSVEKELGVGVKDVSRRAELISCFHLEHLLDRHPMTLSGGEQQRLLIANSLLSDKEIFIFDEPTSGLDYQQMMEVVHQLHHLKRQNKVVIVISHDYELLELVCDVFLDMKDLVRQGKK